MKIKCAHALVLVTLLLGGAVSCNAMENATQAQPAKPCDGGTSKCGGCQARFNKPCQLCHNMFDKHAKDGEYTPQQIMECYERCAAFAAHLGIYPQEAEAKRIHANHGRMFEEGL